MPVKVSAPAFLAALPMKKIKKTRETRLTKIGKAWHCLQTKTKLQNCILEQKKLNPPLAMSRDNCHVMSQILPFGIPYNLSRVRTSWSDPLSGSYS